MAQGVKFSQAAPALSIPLRTAYAWRERGTRLSVEFLDDIDAVPETDRIYLHFLHEIERAKATCIVKVIAIANRKIRTTSDALKFLEYVCPEEFGPSARRKLQHKPDQTFELNQELCSIMQAVQCGAESRRTSGAAVENSNLSHKLSQEASMGVISGLKST